MTTPPVLACLAPGADDVIEVNPIVAHGKWVLLHALTLASLAARRDPRKRTDRPAHKQRHKNKQSFKHEGGQADGHLRTYQARSERKQELANEESSAK